MWHVWTDGSAICDESVMLGDGRRFPGGWAAVIEHGSDGYVVRGRVGDTTNVRMELQAAIEGLREVPAGARATLHFDCTVILSVWDRWTKGQPMQAADDDLWRLLGVQFDRLWVRLDLIGKGGHPVHRRAHAMAGAEARAQARGLPAHAEILTDVNRLHRDRRVEARKGFGLSQENLDRLARYGKAI